MLQAMKEEPPLALKCKDKFLIQSTTITPEKETLSLSDIVRTVFFQFSFIPLLTLGLPFRCFRTTFPFT